MKIQAAHPDKETAAVGSSPSVRPVFKHLAIKAFETIEAQQAKQLALKKHKDELAQAETAEELDAQVSGLEGEGTWLVAQAGAAGQWVAGAEAAGVGAGAAGIGTGAAAAAASSGVAVGIANTGAIFSAVLPVLQAAVPTLSTGVVVAGVAAAAVVVSEANDSDIPTPTTSAVPGPLPVITIDQIAGDDILTSAEIFADTDGDGQIEAGEGFIEVTGSVTGASAGDTVKITVNGREYSGNLTAGGFYAINVLGTDLRDDLTLEAEVTSTNALGQTVAANTTKTIELFTVDNALQVALTVLSTAGSVSTVQFTFSEAISPYPDLANPGGFIPFLMGQNLPIGSPFANIGVTNGMLSSFVQDPNDPTVWTALFTSDNSGLTGVITLPTGSFRDLQNNNYALEASLPIWRSNVSGLTIDYLNSDQTRAPLRYGSYRTNNWDRDTDYRTDSDSDFEYDFGRIFWDGQEWQLRNWYIGEGDRIRGASVFNSFTGEQFIDVPDSFGTDPGGDDQIDENQFEVFYGVLSVDGTFTVTSTEQFESSRTNYGSATHTMILFDNDTRDRVNNDLMSNGVASYLPPNNYSQPGVPSSVYLDDPYWLDAFVVTGVYKESGWSVDGPSGAKKLSWLREGSGVVYFIDNGSISAVSATNSLYETFLGDADAAGGVVSDGLVDVFSLNMLDYQSLMNLTVDINGTPSLAGVTAKLFYNGGAGIQLDLHLDGFTILAAVNDELVDAADVALLDVIDYANNGLTFWNTYERDYIELSISTAGYSENYYLITDILIPFGPFF